MVFLGKYFIKAFSTKLVKFKSSTMACALACFNRLGLRNRVTRCFSFFVIVRIVQLVVVFINTPMRVLYFKTNIFLIISLKYDSVLYSSDYGK